MDERSAGKLATKRAQGAMRRRLLKSLGITVFAFLISLVMVSPLSFSMMSLFAMPEANDFTISDFYHQVANRRDVRTLEPRIVIADIGSADRVGIASAIEDIVNAGAEAVGVDITFLEPRDPEEDAWLIETLRSAPRLVMASTVSEQPDGTFKSGERSFFIDRLAGAAEGAVNFPTKTERGTIREFRTWYDTIPSFAVAMAGKIDPGSVAELRKRGLASEVIDYPSREFTVIPIDELGERTSELKDKIVLIGAAGELDDVHVTPIEARMPGIRIHAYALSQILGHRYYLRTGKAFDWTVAFLLCFGLIFMSLSIKPTVKGLITRLLQFLLVYVAMQAGYALFVDRQIVVNFSYILLMLAFGLIATDIWNGLTVILNRLSAYLDKKRHKTYAKAEPAPAGDTTEPPIANPT